MMSEALTATLRFRGLLIDARSSMEAAREVAKLMANELGRYKGWENERVRAYRELAQGYLVE